MRRFLLELLPDIIKKIEPYMGCDIIRPGVGTYVTSECEGVVVVSGVGCCVFFFRLHHEKLLPPGLLSDLAVPLLLDVVPPDNGQEHLVQGCGRDAVVGDAEGILLLLQ